MKIRMGFVSNSSSSSFVIVLKTDQPLRESLELVFGPARSTPFANVVDDVIKVLHGDIYEDPLKAMLEEYGESDLEELYGYLQDAFRTAIKNDWRVICGSASDEDGGAEALLCSMDLDYEDEHIILKKEAYY